MQLSSILITTLLTITTPPDLCADVYLDDNGDPLTDAAGLTWSRFCARTGPVAPVIDLDVCCATRDDEARCSLPNAKGGCSRGYSLYYCEHGEVSPKGTVDCYQPIPSICDHGFCLDVMPPDGGPLENDLCCWGGGYCNEIESAYDIYVCGVTGGYSGYCKNGTLYPDGTVECFD
ncbi:MAG: hypothetical protein R6X02_36070 [Enhygromyxa sp.]